tara:strand:- start:12 stop:782 length:771 start_codon:yes stop_codon:yes gene_type:complete
MKTSKKEPQVDIIIPNYNKDKYLTECIESVINQTYKNWFLYIIDDNSKDKSKEILQKYKTFQNIKVLSLNKNKGPSFCRNLGMRISNAQFISFLDSDDIWTSDKLKTQINFMLINNYEFTYTDYIPFFHKNKNKKYINNTTLEKSFNFNEFILNTSINSSTMILKRESVGLIRFKKTKLLEDYLFKCEVLKKIRAYKINKPLAYYRIIPGARSSNKILNVIWLWKINKNYNKLNFFINIKTIFLAIFNSFKKYGVK